LKESDSKFLEDYSKLWNRYNAGQVGIGRQIQGTKKPTRLAPHRLFLNFGLRPTRRTYFQLSAPVAHALRKQSNRLLTLNQEGNAAIQMQ
jgi:hypothetical protein